MSFFTSILQPPSAFGALPDYFVEDIADMLRYVRRSQLIFSLACVRSHQSIRFDPMVVERNVAFCGASSFVSLFVTLIGSGKYVKNPYIRAKLVQVQTHFIVSKIINLCILSDSGLVFAAVLEWALRAVLRAGQIVSNICCPSWVGIDAILRRFEMQSNEDTINDVNLN